MGVWPGKGVSHGAGSGWWQVGCIQTGCDMPGVWPVWVCPEGRDCEGVSEGAGYMWACLKGRGLTYWGPSCPGPPSRACGRGRPPGSRGPGGRGGAAWPRGRGPGPPPSAPGETPPGWDPAPAPRWSAPAPPAPAGRRGSWVPSHGGGAHRRIRGSPPRLGGGGPGTGGTGVTWPAALSGQIPLTAGASGWRLCRAGALGGGAGVGEGTGTPLSPRDPPRAPPTVSPLSPGPRCPPCPLNAGGVSCVPPCLLCPPLPSKSLLSPSSPPMTPHFPHPLGLPLPGPP